MPEVPDDHQGEPRPGRRSWSRGTRTTLLAVAVTSLLAGLLPVPGAAQTSGEERVFPEPVDSTDFITRGPEYAPEEFRLGMEELEARHGRYLEFTTIREELDEPLAVSVGADGVPAWHSDDTGDGLDFYVAALTDSESLVPDEDKGYVLFTVAHAGEWCAREAVPRFFEDLLELAESAPETVLEGGVGLDGEEVEITVGEALERTKLLFVDVAPDGWVAGERNAVALGPVGVQRQYSQSNGAGVNSNRVAYQDGWVFPDDEVIRSNGYSTMTQPEGIVTTQYLRQVREEELGGRPFATSMDFHGPAPVGAMLFHDQGNDPAKLDRLHDLAERISDRAYDTLADHITEPGAEAHRQFAGSIDDGRQAAFSIYQQIFGGVDEKALYLTLHWNEYATAWEHIDYTVSSSFGGWAGSEAGLGADAFSHEMPCEAVTNVWEPPAVQVFVDNIRSMAEAMVVHGAFHREREVVTDRDLGGAVGFVDTGQRITDADGNPSPPPEGERNPLVGELEQVPYDVTNTDYFRDLRQLTDSPIIELSPDDLAADTGEQQHGRRGGIGRAGDLGRPDHSRRPEQPGRPPHAVPSDRDAGATDPVDDLDTLVVADHTQADPERLRAFAEGGGNLVLTDAALQLAPEVAGLDGDAVTEHRSYVGYADLDDEHPWAEPLYERARQMFDPVGLGYPLLMERDQYWPCSATGDCEESITHNSSPMWTVDRDSWESMGGETIGTADPPEAPKGRYEGTDEDKTIIGKMPLGDGRLVIFGGLLPQPSEDHPHWYGLNGYTISIPGQQLLLQGLTWERP